MNRCPQTYATRRASLRKARRWHPVNAFPTPYEAKGCAHYTPILTRGDACWCAGLPNGPLILHGQVPFFGGLPFRLLLGEPLVSLSISARMALGLCRPPGARHGRQAASEG